MPNPTVLLAKREISRNIKKNTRRFVESNTLRKICICQPSQAFLEWLTLLLDGKDYVQFRNFSKEVFSARHSYGVDYLFIKFYTM